MRYPYNYAITEITIELFAARTDNEVCSGLRKSLPYKALSIVSSGRSTEHLYVPDTISWAAAENGYFDGYTKPLATTAPLQDLLKLEFNLSQNCTDWRQVPDEFLQGKEKYRKQYRRAFTRMSPLHQEQHTNAVYEIANWPGCPLTISEIASWTELQQFAPSKRAYTPHPSNINDQDVNRLISTLQSGPKTTEQLRTAGICHPASVAAVTDPSQLRIRKSLHQHPDIAPGKAKPWDYDIVYSLSTTSKEDNGK